jgi:hypothetical protein
MQSIGVLEDGGRRPPTPPFPQAERVKKHHNFVAERDNSFHSSPCFCQFIRM